MSPGLLMPSPSSENPARFLIDTLTSSQHEFLTPSYELHASALALAKEYLDSIAALTSEIQENRLEAGRRKRKRVQGDDGEAERNVLRLKEVFLDGFTVEGVWGQARRILEASADEVDKFLAAHKASTLPPPGYNPFSHLKYDANTRPGADDLGQSEGDALGRSDEQEDEELADLVEYSEGDEEASEDLDEDSDDRGELASQEGDEEDIEDDSELDTDEVSGKGRRGTFVKDKHGLNDGFFDIDEFNKDSEFLEQADERGEDDGAASDEEEIDWNADPTSQGLDTSVTKSGKAVNGSSKRADHITDDEEEDEDGPTFGNADLDAPWSDDEDGEGDNDIDDQQMEESGMNNTNDIRYEDFFEPPPRALKKSKRMRALPKTQPPPEHTKPSDEDVQRNIDLVRRDLFEDEFSEAEESDDEGDEDAPSMRNLSTHEKRRVALAKQIRELEAASIAKRDWQLSGEATAHVRPENALLEEDLEFERAGKPVPVITAEVSSTIEDMIKRRILDRQFDEVIRRRPGTDAGSSLEQGQPRRGLMELSDQKDPQGLAESYEQSYLAQTDPNAKDPRSEALKSQHAEIERLWSEVSGKLDALSSWRYKPKPPGVEVRVVTDAPKVLMEDARPSGVEGVRDEQGGLAPQEVFRVADAGKENAADGVVSTKGGGVVSKDELSREQKVRRRRREKERMKKKDSTTTAAPASSKPDAVAATSRKSDQADVVQQLKSGGVKVIGKGGQLQDVEGQKIKERGAPSGSNFKL